MILFGGLSLNILILVLSKYLTFIGQTVSPILHTWFHTNLTLPSLPLILGISFITFHKISYLVDSYQGRSHPPRHFFDCMLYIFLFPQLIAGPIIRYHDIGHQIHERDHSANQFLSGFLRFSIGLVKKILIADTLGITADKVFHLAPTELSSLFAWGGIMAYSLQIYFDFSGYSDMAIGLARMMGFHFPENFNRPYIAQSITEFWQRWHISLSNWMRLYLYIPLGGNRGSAVKTYLNLWMVFLISGLWHGASWNFIIWGAYYGFFLSLERATSSVVFIKRLILPSILRRILTLLIVMVGWVFFRSPTIHDAVYFIGVMFGIENPLASQILPSGIIFNHHAISALMVASFFAIATPPKSTLSYGKKIKAMWINSMSRNSARTISIQFLMTVCLLLISAAAILSSDYTPFLYFRF